PACATLKSAKLATPFCAATVLVPDSVSPPGFDASATVTLPLKLVRVLPSASWATTRTAGLMATPATAALGCTVTVSCDAATTTPLKTVPTGLTSTSSRSWSPGFGSDTVALKITDRPGAVPPTGMAVAPSLWNCAVSVGGEGGCGMVVTKSPSVSAFPPNAVQA